MSYISVGLSFLLSYLVGGFPTGPLVARFKHVDLRRIGSGNIGATNAYRALGLKWAAAVFAGDMMKGLAPVLAARLLLGPGPAAVAAAGAVLGHVFNPYLGFRGGKGVATGFGAAAGISPLAGMFVLAAWAVTLQWKRMVSLASLTAAAGLPLAVLLAGAGRESALAGLIVGVVVVYAHRGNVGRIMRGEEPRIGAEKGPPHGEPPSG